MQHRAGWCSCIAWGRDLFIPATARAESSPWVVKHFTTNDGSLISSVTSIALAKRGFLWATGYNGLARFDDTKFRACELDRHPLIPSNRALRSGPIGWPKSAMDCVRL